MSIVIVRRKSSKDRCMVIEIERDGTRVERIDLTEEETMVLTGTLNYFKFNRSLTEIKQDSESGE